MTPPRAARAAILCSASLLLLAAPSPARADDWLALYPECAFDPHAITPGRTALVYPRAGLPAVVEQGEALITRVAVPAGLTPPPGIQQDRALEGWSAELVGEGHGLDRRAEHRYPLRIVDVRPDGPSSLVYRATLRVPAWAAPGTYGLRVTAPGGGDAVAGAVRILPRGERPRVALLGAPTLDRRDPTASLSALSATLARLPVDVWVAPHEPALAAALARARLSDPRSTDAPPAALLLLPAGRHGLPAVLRHGEEALVLGTCEDRFLPFDAQLAGVLRAEARRPRALRPEDLPASGLYRLLDEAEARPLPTGACVIARSDGALAIEAPGDAEATLTVVLPDDGRRTEVSGAATVSWWPATPLRAAGSLPSIAARLTVEAGGRAAVRRGAPEALSLEIWADAEEVATATPVRFEARPSGPVQRIAWQLAEDVTATGDVAEHRWAPLGEHRVEALAISAEGVAARGQAVVAVRTHEATGCDCGVIPGASRLGQEFLPLALVLIQLARRRPGNRRRPPRRLEPR